MADRKVYEVDIQRAKQSKQRLEEEAQKANLPMWKIPVGTTKFRILPPWSEAGDIAFECKSHWNVPPNDRMYNCLKVINKSCPLCDLANEYRNKGKKNLASKLYSTRSFYYNVIVRGEEDKGIQIMRCGIILHKDILSYVYDEDYQGFTDLQNGRDITVERVGTTKDDTRYILKMSPSTSPIHSNQTTIDKWVDEMFDLDTDIADFKDSLELRGVVDNIYGGGLRETTVVNETETLSEPIKAIEVKEEVVKEKGNEKKNEKEELLAQIESLL